MKAITTTFSGPTSRRGSRIIAREPDGNEVIFDHNHADSHDQAHANAARALCKKMGWTGWMIQGNLGSGKEVFVWAEWGEGFGSMKGGNYHLPSNLVVIDGK